MSLILPIISLLLASFLLYLPHIITRKLLLLLMSTTRQSNKDTYIIIIMKLSVLCGIFFSSALKDNENLEFGILTGILRIAKESLFSGLNNLVVNTILDDKYSEYFGFTVNDISNMATYYGMAEKLSEIKEWYDGYLFGNTEIYNPWSVINYFNNNCKPKAFWSRTSGNEIIGELIRSSDKEVYESLSLYCREKKCNPLLIRILFTRR